MAVYADPAGGAWYSCSTGCRFTGDSVQLYQKVKQIDNVPAAIHAMHAAGIDFRGGAPSPTVVSQYQVALDTRLGVNKFWEEASKLLYAETPLSPTFRSLLAKYRLPCNPSSLEPADGIRRFLGAATPQMISESLVSKRLMQFPPLKGNMLVSPAYKLPGYITGLCLYGSKGIVEADLKLGKSQYDAGLGMLETVTPGETLVLATNERLVAAHLQKLRLLTNSKPFPLVTWSDRATTAWNAVIAGKVVFWATEITLALLNHAKQVKNAFIAQKPQMLEPLTPDSAYKLLEDGESGLMASIFSTAIPFASCLKKYLFSHQATAASILEALALTETQRQDLIAACRHKSEQDEIRRWLSRDSVETSVFYAGRIIVEREEGYFAKPKALADRELQISNVRIFQEFATYFSKSDDVVIDGHVVSCGKSTPFSVTDKQLKKDPMGWLVRLQLEDGSTYPMVAKGWEKNLVPLSALLHPPDARVGVEKAGWEGARFVLPAFDISGGQIENRLRTCRGGVPGESLKPELKLKASQLECVAGDGNAKVGFWALFALMMRNVLAPVKGWKTSTIGVISPGVEHPAVEWFIRAFGLRELSLTGKITQAKLAELAGENDFPLVVRVPSDYADVLPEWVSSGLRANIIVRVTEAQARAGLMHSGWSFVKVPYNSTFDLDPAAGLFVPYLALMQSYNYQMQDRGTPHITIMRTLRDWLHFNFEKFDFVAMDRAEDAVWPTDDTTQAHGQFIDLALWLTKRGFMPETLIEMGDKEVTVSLSAIGSLLDSLKCPAVPVESVTAAMTDAKAMVSCTTSKLVVSRAFWDQRVRRFDEFHLADPVSDGA